VVAPRPQVDGQRAGRGRGEGDEPPLADGTGALQRDEADQRVLDHVRRERPHHHPEQLRAADALAAQDADDGVVTGGFEVSCPAAAGDLQESVDELSAQSLGASLDFRVAVQRVGAGAGVVALALEEVE
jgi:hypothetical protein